MGAIIFLIICLWMICDIANNLDKQYNPKRNNRRKQDVSSTVQHRYTCYRIRSSYLRVSNSCCTYQSLLIQHANLQRRQVAASVVTAQRPLLCRPADGHVRMDIGEEPYFRAGDLVLCKLRNGHRRLVIVLKAYPYQLWRGNSTNNRWRYTVLYSDVSVGKLYKMHLRPEWLLQRITGGGQDGQR